jgi:16S rRNA (guanine527-N7)-methyltransferase
MVEAAVHAASAAERLRLGASQLGLELCRQQVDDLMTYLDLMERWGSRFNLTAVRDRDAMVVTHLLDALSIAPLVRQSTARHWLDAGSGAGLPGIPLAIALPEVRITSVDTVQKKIAFQTQVKGALKLANLDPMQARVEALTLSIGADAAMFRAFASLKDGLAGIASALPHDALVIAMKANLDDAELTDIGAGWRLQAVKPLEVPGLDARRCAVLLNRR